MLVTKNEIPVFLVNLVYILVFGSLSVGRKDYEFVIYTLVIIVFAVLILLTQRKVEFPLSVLWGLTLWGFVHMAGGHIFLGGTRLYDVVFVHLVKVDNDEILRYDQIVHVVGFGVATLVCYHLLSRHLPKGARPTVTLSALVALMGMGLGALNEVIELGVVLVAPQSGVGGYYNTGFDLVSNAVGAILAVVWINLQAASRKKRENTDEAHQQGS